MRLALRQAIERVRLRLSFATDAMVLMPDHLHCIWPLPDGDADFSSRWSQIKHHVSYSCGRLYPMTMSKSRQNRGAAAIWQRRFWEHQIRDQMDFERHVDYIHFNPVKHGLAAYPSEWSYSTFGRFVREGVYPANRGGSPACERMEFE